MPQDKDDKGTIIPVDLIRETTMPPYEYQKPKYGFGSTSTGQPLDQEQDDEDPKKTRTQFPTFLNTENPKSK